MKKLIIITIALISLSSCAKRIQPVPSQPDTLHHFASHNPR